MYPVTNVDDDEDLYRRVPQERGLVVIDSDGTMRFSGQLFSDRRNRPSVDRANLCNNDPSWTQAHPSDGVVKVIAREVRALTPFPQFDAKNKPLAEALIDVEHKPIENIPGQKDNPAHAEIYADPPGTGSFHKRLREALAILANQHGWLVEPHQTS